MASRYELYGGPADGIWINLDPEMQHLDQIYITLPLKGKQTVYREPPRIPYTTYRLGTPKPHKAHWCGDTLSEPTPEKTDE